MADGPALVSTNAVVRTDRPERYGKQLVTHLSRRHGGQWSAESGSGWIELGSGRASVTAGEGELLLHITAPPDELEQLEDVLARHLVRFGERDRLVVTWKRDVPGGHPANPTDT